MKHWLQSCAEVGLLCLCLASGANAQQWSLWQGPAGGAQIRARLQYKAEDAANHIAAVEVEVRNVWLHSPDVVPTGLQEGVLDYGIDNCPRIITTDTHIRFEEVRAGKHTIDVRLLGTDNRPLGPQLQLALRVP